jgi:hypothetical protein
MNIILIPAKLDIDIVHNFIEHGIKKANPYDIAAIATINNISLLDDDEQTYYGSKSISYILPDKYNLSRRDNTAYLQVLLLDNEGGNKELIVDNNLLDRLSILFNDKTMSVWNKQQYFQQYFKN